MYTARVQGSELIKASSARKCILNLWIWQSDLLAGWGKQKEFLPALLQWRLQAIVKIYGTMM